MTRLPKGHKAQPTGLRVVQTMYTAEQLREVIAKEREKVAAWMMRQGYATGHGDTVEDLLKELEWQVAEREREACAKVCDDWPNGRDDVCEIAAAIRARGNT